MILYSTDQAENIGTEDYNKPIQSVSYTHLTLPTILRV